MENFNAFQWIPVSEQLPDEGQYVLIWVGTCQVARIKKGISEEERAAMKRGQLNDPETVYWEPKRGSFKVKRSSIYGSADVHGNNLVPYHWYANGGPMEWFGQDVTHWAYLPDGPVEESKIN